MLTVRGVQVWESESSQQPAGTHAMARIKTDRRPPETNTKYRTKTRLVYACHFTLRLASRPAQSLELGFGRYHTAAPPAWRCRLRYLPLGGRSSPLGCVLGASSVPGMVDKGAATELLLSFQNDSMTRGPVGHAKHEPTHLCAPVPHTTRPTFYPFFFHSFFRHKVVNLVP